ncbi:hypothetical protein COCVIDRAFT_102534 [Bipolaris victoriae FI3]|uniref:Uncharacterized protein n=1 Tax=Bipolaris victoriae (strain FI3) TaxID=930091 RepID=W7EN92_BIPV3|nr:hypothetical protein COCVIDRAFT_102534 [Bipolaris victoriae FI3]
MVSLRPPYSNATKREFLRLTSSSADGTEKQTNSRKKRKQYKTLLLHLERSASHFYLHKRKKQKSYNS